jgi:hypothetical protein
MKNKKKFIILTIKTTVEFNNLLNLIQTLTFEYKFNQKLNIPNSVQTLTICRKFNKDVFIHV